MRIIAFIATLSLSVLFATSGCAAVQEDHKAHHPATSNPTQKSSENTVPAAHSDAHESMDSQMKSMRAIHEKMMRATSTDERKKLMAEHSKAMQDGMAMMKNMPMMNEHSGHSDMNAMHDMGAMKCDMKDGMSASMTTKHQMMEKRMQMMETMMQMMMDRMINDDYDAHQTSVKK